jgi:hypothetical protein
MEAEPSSGKITLADVLKTSAEAKVHLECAGCHRVVVMSARELAEKWGQHLRLDVIERRGRCRACGSTEIDCRPEY